VTGTVAWFARNRVAANLLMAVILVSGAITVFGIPLSWINPNAPSVKPVLNQEVFPEFSLDLITITVPYLGAAPEEVEEGVCVRIEEEIQDLDDVKRITSIASEGVGIVSVELELGADVREVLDDVKARVDAIDTFPEETEKPIIRELTNRRQVIDVAIYGDADERSLRLLAERVRDDLTALPGITLAETSSVRPYEVSIEVSEEALRRHGLTFDAVAGAVRRSSLDLPGGSVKTAGGEILLRTKGQAYSGPEFEDLVLLTRADGTHLRLGEVARVVDGFEDTDLFARFDGKPTATVNVFRAGNQDALEIAASVKRYIADAQPRMPEGIRLTTWNDASRILKGRRDLLLRNGATGLLLVTLTLALFLRFRLAFWVALGMAMAFLGAIWLMPVLGVTINLISLFAFILVLGIVVDDAIIVGENVYTHQRRHGDGLRGAIEGAQEISLPVVFAVLTTVAAFTPLLRVAGMMGKVMRTIPLIVIPCLLWSLVESLWILPAHLSHYRENGPGGKPDGWHLWRRFQARFASGLKGFVAGVYTPLLELGLRWRYMTVAIGICTLLITVGLVRGGFIRFQFFPDVESDFMAAEVKLPQGAPVEATSEAVRRLEESAAKLRAEARERSGGQDVFKHLMSVIGEQPFNRIRHQNPGGIALRETSSNLGEVTVELRPAEDRRISSAELVDRWRELTGPIPDALELSFSASLFSPGEDIDVQLTGANIDHLRAAADELKLRLGEYAGVHDISDSFVAGKRELKLGIKPAAEVVGLSLADLARQVRQAFYGEEAQRIQRGRDEVRVMVRYPEDERRSLGDLENMRIRTPDGLEVPFSEVATVALGRGFASIDRVNRQRAIDVTADVDPARATAGDVIGDLEAKVLPEILFDYPGVHYTFEGQQAEQRDTMGGLARGFVFALVLIYVLLAVPLKSYVQPLIIMSAIPFGFVGAIAGHAIMRLDLTILSMFGLVALTGVVVNDSLVMVDFINRNRRTRDDLSRAVRAAGVARFRPILLTSLTTFAGLFPLMMERSMQARFLIPMAVSLAFGVIFATFITLMLVPAAYLILEDLKGLPARSGRRRRRRRADAGETGERREQPSGAV
jgi:multidrug efflux pump subunit AcrB